VKPNTMYLEAGPVIETPLAAAQAVHEMLLQSWGGELRVFPALPPAWKDAVFHDLRAEGAFLLTAIRRGGRTVLVRVHSLAGEPAVLRTDPDFVRSNPRVVAAAGRTPLHPQADGSWKLTLSPGESVLLHAPDLPTAAQQVTPVPRPPDAANPFGLP
jgi:alpha-L-fucosidase 2